MPGALYRHAVAMLHALHTYQDRRRSLERQRNRCQPAVRSARPPLARREYLAAELSAARDRPAVAPICRSNVPLVLCWYQWEGRCPQELGCSSHACHRHRRYTAAATCSVSTSCRPQGLWVWRTFV